MTSPSRDARKTGLPYRGASDSLAMGEMAPPIPMILPPPLSRELLVSFPCIGPTLFTERTVR